MKERVLPHQFLAQAIELIDSLRRVADAHRSWALEAHNLLLHGDPAPPPGEHECDFGRWYADACAHSELKGNALLAAIAPRHRSVHQAAQSMWEARRSGRVLPLAAYRLFHESIRRFDQSVQQLERDLWVEVCLVDPLTGLRNRAMMMAELNDERQRAKREGRPCSIALFDIDDFKGLNDRHGHLIGDRLLVLAADRILRRMRTYDRAYRYGGEEFLVCLPDTDLARGGAIAERLRVEIARERLHVDDQAVGITVSGGLAPLDGSPSVEEAIARADRALYTAKGAGRNRVAVWRGMEKPGDK
ncbi:diguanylate cyclase [Sulfurifustis variabilis]|uniref:diguanylate cyclase n=1 Tax=Sulfurifustis variabilis TaxID=1675686 RepID=A0A1B4VAE5_9GAMM|nr:diguanylate cyclase [Sulfurifustis variabilis]BAU46891.1 diguanylate cyclase [Sulfurifustis variabilis]